MDAEKYLEEKDRMCHFFRPKKCVGCPFHEAIQGVTTSCCAYEERLWNYEDYVTSVSIWSSSYPRKTNRDKFEEVFGFDLIGNPIDWKAWSEKYYKEETNYDN